jgi:hypothetical protein
MAPATSAFSVRGTRLSVINRPQSKTVFGTNRSKFFMRLLACRVAIISDQPIRKESTLSYHDFGPTQKLVLSSQVG